MESTQPHAFQYFHWHRHKPVEVAEETEGSEDVEDVEEAEGSNSEADDVDYFLNNHSHRGTPLPSAIDSNINTASKWSLFTLVNTTFIKGVELIDFLTPQNSVVFDYTSLQALEALEWVKQSHIVSSSGLFIVLFLIAIIVIALFPFILLLLIMLFSYTSVSSAIFTFGVATITLLSSIGFLPIIIVVLVLLLITILLLAITYFTIVYTYDFLITNRISRSFITMFADMVPPSVGKVEVSVQDQKVKQNQSIPKITEATKEAELHVEQNQNGNQSN